MGFAISVILMMSGGPYFVQTAAFMGGKTNFAEGFQQAFNPIRKAHGAGGESQQRRSDDQQNQPGSHEESGIKPLLGDLEKSDFDQHLSAVHVHRTVWRICSPHPPAWTRFLCMKPVVCLRLPQL